ncbi:MAG: hypothetical protein II077_01290, partial [Treponema sp.]|nr:hypothetical protein [Treponema sp.]
WQAKNFYDFLGRTFSCSTKCFLANSANMPLRHGLCGVPAFASIAGVRPGKAQSHPTATACGGPSNPA